MKVTGKSTALMAVFASLAIVFSYVEVLIPFNIGIPGIKLGIANIGIILALYILGGREAIVVNFIRIFVIALFFGNIYSFAFSFVGGISATFVMILLKKSKSLNIMTVSVTGAVVHNTGQLLVAFCIVRRVAVLYYSPVLILAGIITGLIIGYISAVVIKKVRLEKLL